MRTSHRILGVAVAAALSLGATGARADVFVVADINKTKTTDVDEQILILKDIELFVVEDIPVNAAAEHNIVKNQRNQFNFLEDETAISSAIIDVGTAVGANGIILINQSPAFLNNQANEAGITSAVDRFGFVDPLLDDGGVFTHSQTSVQQINGADPLANGGSFPVASKSNGDGEDSDGSSSKVTTSVNGNGSFVNQYIALLPANYETTINGAFTDGSGIVGVNQAAGGINNQDNSIGISIGGNSVYALGEVDLGQFNASNLIDVIDIARIDSITGGAFAGFSGIATVNQSSGSINNQANVVNMAVDVATTGLPPIPPGAGGGAF